MFGFLKKKLKDGIDKISKGLKEKEEEKIEEAVEEVKKEEKIEEKEVKEIVKEVEKEIEETPVEEVKPEVVKEKPTEIEERAEEKIEEAKELLETAKEIEHIEEKPKKRLFGLLKPKEKTEAKKGIIEKIKKKITEKKITEDDLKDVLKDFETGLIQSDVAVEVAEKICKDLKSNLVGKSLKRGYIEKIIKDSFRKSISDILSVESFNLIEKVRAKKPFLIVFLGFNGSGKTSSIGKIGYLLKEQKFKVIFAAGDCFRAASIEQLEEHGKKLNIEVIKHKYGADPAAVIFDAVKHAKAKDIDVILADTAGRSHANINLMEELKKIIKVNKPDLKILVLDALTGNDIYDQCKTFNNAVGVDALIITKADVYEKGGATISASHTINKPILYMGVGQKYEDLEKFDSNKIIEKLLD